ASVTPPRLPPERRTQSPRAHGPKIRISPEPQQSSEKPQVGRDLTRRPDELKIGWPSGRAGSSPAPGIAQPSGRAGVGKGWVGMSPANRPLGHTGLGVMGGSTLRLLVSGGGITARTGNGSS